jgi:hypothetical protein
MLLHLEKLLVKREDLGGTPGTGRRKAACGVRQNLLQMTRRFHRKFELLFNLKLDRQNPKSHLRWRRRDRPKRCA